MQKLNPRWQNSRRPNLRWPPSSSWVRMNEWSFFVQMNWGGKCEWSFCQWWEPILARMSVCKWWESILARIEMAVWVKSEWTDDVLNPRWLKFKMTEFKMAVIIMFSWEWMSLSQIELVWVRVRVEGKCFWVNLREENKVSEFHNAEAESKMAEFKKAKFKMATIIKLSQNEWVKFFCSNGGEASVSEVFFVQMVGTNLGKYECVWEEKLWWLIPRWPNSRWQNSRWLPSSSWVRMNEFESDWISLNQSQSEGRVFLSESERRKQGVWIPTWQKLNPRWQNSRCRIYDATIQLSQNEWVRLN